MNLRAIANSATVAINPNVLGTVSVSNGYATAGDGSRAPAYAVTTDVPLQVQALTAGEVQHLDSLNIQGVTRSIYIMGRIDGLVRPDGKGGDLITFPDDPALPDGLSNTVWMVRIVFESWDVSGWTKVGVSRQLNPPEDN